MQQTSAVRKTRVNVYTMMLILSFLALLTACVLLKLELDRWGSYPWWNTSGAQPTTWQTAPLSTADAVRLA